MLLTIRTTTEPVTDLGYLLHKHPDKVQEFNLSFGKAQIFYPELDEEACTVALLVNVDTLDFARKRKGPGGKDRVLQRYVNDRPYVASSFLSVAISDVFSSALNGRCKDRPDAVEKPLDLEVSISTISCHQGEELLRRFFEPLGYTVEIQPFLLDPKFPQWGDGHYYTLKLSGKLPLRQLLLHLYVLIPVLDNRKHYWIGEDEVEKLLAKGEGWLSSHPEKELITKRYLRYRHALVAPAIERLVPEGMESENEENEESDIEKTWSLNEQRLGSVLGVLKASGATTVIDLGCGEGRLLQLLLPEKQFTEVVGMDVSHRALESASRNLRLERMSDWQRKRTRLIHGSLIYRDERLTGFAAATLMEVIEHLDPARLQTFQRVIFEFARPATLILTTPNREYNVMWPTLPAGHFRHHDHRFEWTREEFQQWGETVATQFGYNVRFLPIGPEDANVGAPTQMGIFTLRK